MAWIFCIASSSTISLLNDYFDRSRTIVVTTHQVEEIQDVLTDVMFINRGRIEFDCSMEEFESALSGSDGKSRADRRGSALKPMYERQVSAAASCCSIVSNASNWPRLATCASPVSPTCSLRCWAIKAARPKEGLDEYSIKHRARVFPRIARYRTWSSPPASAFTGRCAANCGSTVQSICRRLPRPSLLGFLTGLTLSPAHRHEGLDAPYEFAGILIMGTGFLGGLRLRRAIWGAPRSQHPVLEVAASFHLTTVLAKFTIPLLILPLLSFAITVVTQFGMMLLSSGLSVGTLGARMSFFHMSLMLLYHILTVHGLWYAPLYGWLLLVSAWAPRAPFIWAFLPPFVIWGVEKIAFRTSHFLGMLQYRLSGPEPPTTAARSGNMMEIISALTTVCGVSVRRVCG